MKYDFILNEKQLEDSLFPVEIVAINNQFPGPKIECSSGDTLIIKVRNQLQREISIHWHGITQKRTSNMDGVPYLSHAPIAPNSTYEYNFKVHEQTGTYWYHAHTGLDFEFVFGPLIIYDNPKTWSDVVKYNAKYSYDFEETILISELWSRKQSEIIYGLTHVPFKPIGQSNAVLINGKSEKSRFILKVKPNRKYRLRVTGANGSSLMLFKISMHRFTVIEIDGTLVDPVEVDHLLINSGQRYSIILNTNQKPANYTILAQVVGLDKSKLPYTKATLSYKTLSKPKTVEAKFVNQPIDKWIIPELKTSNWYLNKTNQRYYLPPQEVDRDIVLNITTGNKDGVPVFNINNQLLRPSDFPTLMKSKTPPGVHKMKLGQRVQFVFQQYSESGKACVQHPWHLHGHSFHIVGQGSGVYNPKQDLLKINQELCHSKSLPIFRDTFTHFPNQTPKLSKFVASDDSTKLKHKQTTNSLPNFNQPLVKNCGWVAIRFIADNPGNWLLHCHNGAHLIQGKVLVIQTTL